VSITGILATGVLRARKTRKTLRCNNKSDNKTGMHVFWKLFHCHSTLLTEDLSDIHILHSHRPLRMPLVYGC